MMSHGRAFGSGAAPLMLRLALGVVFIWAGLVKLLGTVPVGPDVAATLANMGVTVEKSPAAPGAPISNAPPTAAPAAAPSSPTQAPAGQTDPATPSAPKDPMPADQFRKPAEGTGATGTARGGAGAGGMGGAAPLDYAAQTPVRMVYMLAMLLHGAANPTPRADGTVPMALWPSALGQGAWPVRLAYMVAFTELIGGAMVLLGLMTRLWAAGLVVVMLGAIWLTQVGPAIQSGDTVLGILPNHPAMDLQAWTPLLWNFTLMMMALAVVLGGSGRPAIDNALFGVRTASDEDDAP